MTQIGVATRMRSASTTVSRSSSAPFSVLRPPRCTGSDRVSMSFCRYCGAALTDPNRCGVCGAYKVESTWHRGAKLTVGVAATETGWRPDPTGRHEGRYFVGGQPTDLIRDGNTEAVDPLGKQQLDQAGAVNISQSAAVSVPSRPGRRRLWWVLAAVVLVLGLVGAGVGVTLFLNRDRESVDDKYLAALRQSGLSESSTLTRTPSPTVSRCAVSWSTVADNKDARRSGRRGVLLSGVQ